MFIDQRLPRMGDTSLFRELEHLGQQARRLYLEPDAGIWEYRGRERIHTHSATMCWVACDRLARIAALLGLSDRAEYWTQWADRIRSGNTSPGPGAISAEPLPAPSTTVNSMQASCCSPSLDRLPNDPRFIKTCDTIGRELMRNGLMLRYAAEDDFGLPEVRVPGLSVLVHRCLGLDRPTGQARELFGELLGHRNAFGMLSEDLHPATGQLWGNIPQTYSMAGLINSATRLSRGWDDAWAPQPQADPKHLHSPESAAFGVQVEQRLKRLV